jgi:hypothetical protein
LSELSELLREVCAAASSFEPDRWSGDDCAVLAEGLAVAAKACDAAAKRATARALECGRVDVEWAARTGGVTPAQARESLATTVALRRCDATGDAVASGALSLTQAREIVAAEAVVPGSESALLAVATSSGMAGLREASRKVRLAAIDREELSRRQWAARSCRHWVDGDGMVAGRFRLPPEVGVAFVTRLDRATDRIHRDARRGGCADAREAHAAEALVQLGDARSASTEGKRRSRAEVVFVCSLDAYRRGRTVGDEVCHAIGAGPVTVDAVRDAIGADAFVKAVVMRGVEIHSIAHVGRRMTAELRTALEVGAPPLFDGAVCTEEGCDRRHDLEWDHVDPVANGGLTSYENLQPRCRPHHWSKTEHDRAAGLLDGRAPPEALPSG